MNLTKIGGIDQIALLYKYYPEFNIKKLAHEWDRSLNYIDFFNIFIIVYEI